MVMLLHSLRQPLLHSLHTSPSGAAPVYALRAMESRVTCAAQPPLLRVLLGVELPWGVVSTASGPHDWYSGSSGAIATADVRAIMDDEPRKIARNSLRKPYPINVQDTLMANSVTQIKHHMNSRNPCNGDAPRIQQSAGPVTASIIACCSVIACNR